MLIYMTAETYNEKKRHFRAKVLLPALRANIFRPIQTVVVRGKDDVKVCSNMCLCSCSLSGFVEPCSENADELGSYSRLKREGESGGSNRRL